jgi:hypothetical protein
VKIQKYFCLINFVGAKEGLVYTAIVNDRFQIKLNDVRDVISYVFNVPLRRAQYSSFEAFKLNCKEAVALTVEFLHIVRDDLVKAGMKGTSLGTITRLITRLNTFNEYIDDSRDKDRLIATVYNLVLSYEGCGLLNGFGFSNRHGDRILGNAEVTPLYPTEIKTKRAILKSKK